MSTHAGVLAASVKAPANHISFLDTLRGLAALQVVLLHAFSSYVPALVETFRKSGPLITWVRGSFLRILYDGDAAVYFFFLLSGYVLTISFKRKSGTFLSVVASRIVRLGVPVVAASLLAASIHFLFKNAHQEAGSLLHSKWFASCFNPKPGWLYYLQDTFLNALFVGYRGSFFYLCGWWPAHFAEIHGSYNDIFWTISTELYGSLFVWGLTRLECRKWVWNICMGILVVLMFRSLFSLFLYGHILAKKNFAQTSRPLFLRPWLFIVGGLFVVSPFCPLGFYFEILTTNSLSFLSGLNLQRGCGVLLFFMGVLQCGPLKKALSHSRLLILGQLSFPIYLVHFPIFLGVCAGIFMGLHAWLPLALCRGIAIVSGFLITFLLAWLFRPIDFWAIGLSKKIRDRF